MISSLRKGKYYHYKLDLLQYLVDNDFLIEIGEGNELSDIAKKLNIPMSSWYDITRDLAESGLIIMRSKNRVISSIIIWMVYEIQLTKEGLEFLTRFRHA